jgi:hypothetical protein
MAHPNFPAARRRFAVANGLARCATLALTILAGQAAAAAEQLQFVAPADHAPFSTVSVSPTSPTADQATTAPAIDMAALANFAQRAPEEIAPGPPAGEIRGYYPITQVSIDIALPEGLAPGDPGTDHPGPTTTPWPRVDDARLWGGWAETDFQWSATRLCHRPLYFEQVNVERYGYTVSPLLQPAISGAHFFLTIPTLPYKMVVQPPRECIYTLGYYRAGSPAPRRWHHLVWDPTAATVEGLVVTGLVFLIP